MSNQFTVLVAQLDSQTVRRVQKLASNTPRLGLFWSLQSAYLIFRGDLFPSLSWLKTLSPRRFIRLESLCWTDLAHLSPLTSPLFCVASGQNQSVFPCLLNVDGLCIVRCWFFSFLTNTVGQVKSASRIAYYCIALGSKVDQSSFGADEFSVKSTVHLQECVGCGLLCASNTIR